MAVIKYPKFVKDVREQQRFDALIAAKSTLIPYVGAGFSFSPKKQEKACPSWSGFLWQLFEQYKSEMPTGEPEKFAAFIKADNYEQALQVLVDTITIPHFRKIIEQTFSKPLANQFPLEFKPKFELFHRAFKGPWLTTNMDKFIEASFAGGAEQLTVVAGFEDKRLVTDLNRSDLAGFLFKLHGDAKDINSLVFAHDDYVKAYGDKERFNLGAQLPQAFKKLFTNHSLLFIGCSLSVDRPLMILQDLAKGAGVKDQFALLKRSDFEGSSDKQKAARANLRSMNITPIWLDDFADIDIVLEHLAPPEINEPFDDAPVVDIFVGREQQLATLMDNISKAGSLFTITDRKEEDDTSQLHHLVGQGGVGKTTLGREVLLRCKEQFADGCIEIRVDKMTPVGFAKALADRLKMAEVTEHNSDEEAQAFISQVLNQKRLLLLLDNVDSGDVLKALLPQQYQSCVIVTSRDTELSDLIRLNCPKVQLCSLELEKFTDDEALALFAKMLGAKFDESPTDTYLAIASQVDFLPIALRLSISTLLFGARLTAEELLNQLKNNQHLQLTEQAAELAVNSQERGLLAVFDLSAPLLTDELKYCLALIAVCEQGPVPEDFLRTLNENYEKGVEDELLISHLRTLERYHWCKRKTVDGLHYYELHQIVRKVVTTQLLQNLPEDEDLEQLFAEVVFYFFIQEPLHFSVLDSWIDQTDKAFLWFKQHQPELLRYWVGKQFCQYCINRGYGERFIRFCKWVIDGSNDDEDIGIALAHQALILQNKGKLDEAFELHEQELQIKMRLNDKVGIANCYHNQGLILHAQQQFAEALALFKQSEQVYIELDDKQRLSQCYGNQAVALSELDNVDAAMALHQKEQKLCEELKDMAGLAACYINQATILINKDQLDEAFDLLKQALEVFEELGDIPNKASALWNMGHVLQKQEDYPQAIELHEQAIELWQSCDMPTHEEEQKLDIIKKYVTSTSQAPQSKTKQIKVQAFGIAIFIVVGLVVYFY